MPSVNMIASKRAEKQKLEEKVRIGFMLVIGSILIALVILSFMTARVYAINRDIESIDAELLKVQPIVKQIHDYESEIKLLMPKLALLDESKQKTLQYYDVMLSLGRNLADKTWLTGVTTKRVVEPSTHGRSGNREATYLNIKGISGSQSLVGETMMRLEQVPLFDMIDLEYTQSANIAETQAVEFSINLRLKELGETDKEVPDRADN